MNETTIRQRTFIDGYELLTTRTSTPRLVEPGPSEAELQKDPSYSSLRAGPWPQDTVALRRGLRLG